MTHSTEPDELHDVLQRVVADGARVAAVRGTGLLDSPPEEVFDALTREAVRLTGAPIAFIALVDRDRDFYKSHAGFGEPLASTRDVAVRLREGLGLTDIVRAVDANGVDIADLELHAPTLDDVFLAKTGRSLEGAAEDEPDAAPPAA